MSRVTLLPFNLKSVINRELTCILPGVYTIMFSMTMYTIYQKRREGVNKFTTTTLILL